MIVREGRYEFDFTNSLRAIAWDGPGTPVPETMKKVDFVVEEPARWLLVEVKDPSNPNTSETQRQAFLHRLKSKAFVNDTLVPKCRDTWTYMHLMLMDPKPIHYVVVITLFWNRQPDRLMIVQKLLRKRLKKEGKEKWKRPYVQECVVLNISGWHKKFPEYPVVDLHGQAQSP